MKECQVFKGENVNFVTVKDKLGSAPPSIIALLKNKQLNIRLEQLRYFEWEKHFMHSLPHLRLTEQFFWALANSMMHA